MQTVGLLAGIGRLPVEFAIAARNSGYRVVTIAYMPDVDKELQDVSDCYYEISVMKAGKIIKTLKSENVTKLTMIGKVTKEILYSKGFIPDFFALRALASLVDRSDDTIMLKAVNMLRKEGIEVMDQTELLKKLFIRPGVYSKRKPSAEELNDAQFALKMARAIGGLDIGQTVVVKNMAVMAVEAIEGTNKCILRGGQLAKSGAVVGKVAKPKQDKRFDMPAVGTETIEAMIAAKAKMLAVEAGATLIVDLDKTMKLADDNNIIVVACAVEEE